MVTGANRYETGMNKTFNQYFIENKLQGKPSSRWGILLLIVLFLVLSHLAVKDFFPNPVFWVLAAIIMVFIGIGWVELKKDNFGFFLIIFLCNHFSFAENQGGLYSYVFFAVIIASLLLTRRKILIFSSVPFIFHVFLIVFFAYQIFGTILNPYSLVSNIQSTIVVLSWLLVFYYTASLKISNVNIKQFLSLWFVVVSWMFIVSLNQKYSLVITQSPLLPQHGTGLAVSGTFKNSELFSEYFCFIFIFSCIIIGNLNEFKVLKIKKNALVFIAFFSLCGLMMGGSRAAILLAGASVFYIVFLNAVLMPTAKNFRQALIIVAALPFFGMLILLSGSLVSVDLVKKDFKKLEQAGLNVKTAISGKGINRGNLFIVAARRLAKKSRWIGYGYNTSENNRKSLELDKELAGYHNLYLSLPFLFGWGGSAMYILLVLGTGLRSYFIYFKSRKLKHYLVPLALGFAMIWGIFLIDQYKISVTRNPSYFFLIWMLLGFTHAIVNSLKEVKSSDVKI
jgi:hypothetical protein